MYPTEYVIHEVRFNFTGRGNHSSTLRVPTLHDCAERDVYQFGVYSGASMKAIASFFRAHEVPFHQIVGFDSFMGLPAEHISAGSQAIYRFRLTKGDWRAGSLSAARYFARSSGSGGDVLAPLAVVLQQLTALVDEPRVRFVSGFFNESLTPQLARTMRPALYIDCDADLYSSTRESLEWMLAHKLVVPGTVLYYDDWQAGGRSGQERAHAEFMKKHKVIAKRLAVTDESVKKAVFEVLTVGQERHRRA